MAEQPAQIFFGLQIVLTARDGLLHGFIETLNADFKLQDTLRKARNQQFQAFRQMIGNDFKVQK